MISQTLGKWSVTYDRIFPVASFPRFLLCDFWGEWPYPSQRFELRIRDRTPPQCAPGAGDGPLGPGPRRPEGEGEAKRGFGGASHSALGGGGGGGEEIGAT